MTTLLADIGGTRSRCALTGGDGAVSDIRVFDNAEYADPVTLLTGYLDGLPTDRRPAAGLLAVAAPVRGDAVQMINIDWRFSADSLRRALGLERLSLLNDFEALALGLPGFGPNDLLPIGGGTALAERPKAVLGPGTGLGVASLVPAGHDYGWLAVSGEGGHVTLPAVTPDEDRLIADIRKRYGHCSAERLISGPGLALLHATLHGTTAVDAAAIAALADAGDQQAQTTFGIFFELLGTVAANLALTIGAFGGVYIGGGIIPRHAERFVASGFRRRFESKGRYGDYLKSIPTWLIVAEHPTLSGLATAVKSRNLPGPGLGNRMI